MTVARKRKNEDASEDEQDDEYKQPVWPTKREYAERRERRASGTAEPPTQSASTAFRRSRSVSSAPAPRDQAKLTWKARTTKGMLWMNSSDDYTEYKFSLRVSAGAMLVGEDFDSIESEVLEVLKKKADDAEQHHVLQQTSLSRQDLRKLITNSYNEVAAAQDVAQHATRLPKLLPLRLERGQDGTVTTVSLNYAGDFNMHLRLEHVAENDQVYEQLAALLRRFELAPNTLAIFLNENWQVASAAIALLHALAAFEGYVKKPGDKVDRSTIIKQELRSYLTEKFLREEYRISATFHEHMGYTAKDGTYHHPIYQARLHYGDQPTKRVQLRADNVAPEEALEWCFLIETKCSERPPPSLGELVEYAQNVRPKDSLIPPSGYVRKQITEQFSYVELVLVRRAMDLVVHSKQQADSQADPGGAELVKDVLSRVETVMEDGESFHVARCEWTGAEVLRSSAVRVAAHANTEQAREMFPPSEDAEITLDGVLQVFFRDVSLSGKTAYYHRPSNVFITSAGMNMLHHRYPPHVHFSNLCLFQLSNIYPAYLGEVDHPVYPIMRRLVKLIRLSYATWWIPCEQYQRALMCLEAYVTSRRAMDFVMDKLDMRFYKAIPSVSSATTGVGDVSEEVLTAIYEQERSAIDKADNNVWTCRPGRGRYWSAKAADVDRARIKARSKLLHEEIKASLNVDLALNEDGVIAFSLDGSCTLDDVLKDIGRHLMTPRPIFTSCDVEQFYANAICAAVWSIAKGVKLPEMTRFCMTSYHLKTVPFLVPYASKGPLSTSPSRFCHEAASSWMPGAHVCGFEDPTVLTLAGWDSDLATFALDAWTVNAALGGRGTEDMLIQLGEIKDMVKLVPGNHWLLSPELSPAQQLVFDEVCEYLEKTIAGDES